MGSFSVEVEKVESGGSFFVEVGTGAKTSVVIWQQTQ